MGIAAKSPPSAQEGHDDAGLYCVCFYGLRQTQFVKRASSRRRTVCENAARVARLAYPMVLEGSGRFWVRCGVRNQGSSLPRRKRRVGTTYKRYTALEESCTAGSMIAVVGDV
eukprot:6214564-Pleurochrysis_carterae.AAC.1